MEYRCFICNREIDAEHIPDGRNPICADCLFRLTAEGDVFTVNGRAVEVVKWAD